MEELVLKTVEIDPREIQVNEDDNPRKNYGDSETWEAFKQGIKSEGLQQNIKIKFLPEHGKYILVHGFRRMRAVTELINDFGIEKCENITKVRADVVDFDEAKTLKYHYLLNSGKEMTDIEQARGLLRLERLTGETNIAELARETNLPYQKAVTLLDFIKRAGTKLTDAVERGEISFSMAYKNILRKSGSVTEQNNRLKDAEIKTQKNGKKKIVIKTKDNFSQNQKKEEKAHFHIKLGNLLVDALLNPDVDQLLVKRLKLLTKGLHENKSNEELMVLLNTNIDLNEE